MQCYCASDSLELVQEICEFDFILTLIMLLGVAGMQVDNDELKVSVEPDLSQSVHDLSLTFAVTK